MQPLFKQEELGQEFVGLPEAVSLLGICAATVRNWIRHQYIKPETVRGKLAFDLKQLKELKAKIEAGEIDRLSRRANKKESALTFVPAEYADSPEVFSTIQYIAEKFLREQLHLETTLLCMALKLLEQKGLVTQDGARGLAAIEIRGQALRKELEWWFDRATAISSPAYFCIVDRPLPVVRDFLGLLYQSLAKEGAKAKGGTYYTPRRVVDSIIKDYVHESSVVLDPCCGTGQFLLAAADYNPNPLNLWGFDVDEVAVRLARLNVITRFPDTDFFPNIYCENTLLAFPSFASLKGREIPRFDVIFTNPPWGSHFSAGEIAQLQKLFPSIKSNESFSLFVEKGLQLLKDGGTLSYILPESFLNIKVHANIRGIVSRHTCIRQAIHLGRIFQNVFTPAIRLDLTKETPEIGSGFAAVKDDRSFPVTQSRLTKNPDHVFDIFNGEDDLSIFEQVYSREHVTLAGNADWALGIVTGDNAKFLTDHHDPHHEPIFTGKDLRRFKADAPKKFIHFRPESFQQVAPTHKYRAPEKLLYKFISDELIFAYDDRKTLSLNSANVLIPALPGLTVKAVLGFLNSSLYQLMFQKKIGAYKILRGDIEKLPFPVINEAEQQNILSFVDVLLNSESSNDGMRDAYRDLDDYIMGLFGLTFAQKTYVLANARVSPKQLPLM
jgi:type I restriction-modification system DNA methylase subunit